MQLYLCYNIINKLLQVITLKAQIQVRIYPDGKIESKTLGIKGKKCTDYIPIFEKMLHAKVIESNYTDEYYQIEQVNQTIETSNNKLGNGE